MYRCASCSRMKLAGHARQRAIISLKPVIPRGRELAICRRGEILPPEYRLTPFRRCGIGTCGGPASVAGTSAARYRHRGVCRHRCRARCRRPGRIKRRNHQYQKPFASRRFWHLAAGARRPYLTRGRKPQSGGIERAFSFCLLHQSIDLYRNILRAARAALPSV